MCGAALCLDACFLFFLIFLYIHIDTSVDEHILTGGGPGVGAAAGGGGGGNWDQIWWWYVCCCRVVIGTRFGGGIPVN